MSVSRHRLVGLLAALPLALAGPALAASHSNHQPSGHGPGTHGKATKESGGSTAASFITGVLPPPPAGSTTQYNVAAEPQIRADAAGNFYISSENWLGAGTDAWKSINGG
ncbi:MAG: hypothetical protein ACYCO3_17080, partial [Mycobacteriales bacterium]